MERREFLGHAVRLVLMIPVASTLACDGAEGTCSDANDASGDADSHGHSLLIPAADLQAPADATYTSTGGDHTHEVSISAAELEDLVADCEVTVLSSDQGHNHSWLLLLA